MQLSRYQYILKALERKYRRYKSTQKLYEIINSKIALARDWREKRSAYEKMRRLKVHVHNLYFEYKASKKIWEKQYRVHIIVLRDKSPEKLGFKEGEKYGFKRKNR